jgi:hypothetical protein
LIAGIHDSGIQYARQDEPDEDQGGYGGKYPGCPDYPAASIRKSVEAVLFHVGNQIVSPACATVDRLIAGGVVNEW